MANIKDHKTVADEVGGTKHTDGSGPPQPDDEGDPDKRRADSDFDDLEIEVDESELAAELHGPTPGRS